MSIKGSDFEKENVIKTLQIQKQILKNKIYNMKLVLASIEEAENNLTRNGGLEWSETVDIVQIIEHERALRQKFFDSSSLSAEIEFIEQLDSDKNWYQWVFERLVFKKEDHILDLGCGEGSLWYKNESRLPPSLTVTLTEVTDDLLSHAKQNLLDKFPHFEFEVAPLEKLNFPDESFDVVIANHVLFFSNHADIVLAEVNRVLKKGGRFYCSTIAKEHMQELEQLIKNYNDNIKLGKSEQLQNFGYEKAVALLEQQFTNVEAEHYHDELVIDSTDRLFLSYIYSMPGQMLDIASKEKTEFEAYLKKQMRDHGSDFKISNSHVLFSSKKMNEHEGEDVK
ncbi:MAG: class I SAM-dependent methyltransferase [Turicibacter sp.]|nr:class I SAM-dependent methyltransferase [Turicibacter sp.]